LKPPIDPNIKDVSAGNFQGTVSNSSAITPQLNSQGNVGASTQWNIAATLSSVVGVCLLLIGMAIFMRGRLKRNLILQDKVDTVYQVIKKHVPSYMDEIQLNLGDAVTVKEKFDDGWAFGFNITTESHGSFPLRCLSDLNTHETFEIDKGSIISSRNSSLRDSSLLLNTALSPVSSVSSTTTH
jgi:hypothetical protein